MPRERKVEVVLDRFDHSGFVHPAGEQRASQHSGHFHITETGHVEVCLWVFEDFSYGGEVTGAQQVINQCGGVGYYRPQEASREARSARTSPAAEDGSSTGSLAEILSKTSGAGGREISRSSTSWTYSVRLCPRFLARRTSSRCSRSGMFLT